MFIPQTIFPLFLYVILSVECTLHSDVQQHYLFWCFNQSFITSQHRENTIQNLVQLTLPSLSNATKTITQPTRKHSRTAKSALSFSTTKGFVMIAIMAVGPMVISLQLPRKIYTKQLINDAYSPYCNNIQQIITFISTG